MSKTSYIHTTLDNNKSIEINSRTSSILTITKGNLDLNDILNPQPAGEKRQIDISWIDKALDKKAFETKYSSWDKINIDQGLWSCSCYGNNTGVVCSSSGQVFTTKNGGLSWEKYSIIENISTIAYGYSKDKESGDITHKFIALSSSGEGVSSSNGTLWQSINIAKESFTSITFLNGVFYVFTSTGSIYVSKDMGILWEKIEHNFDVSFSTATSDNENTIIALGSSGKDRCIYSKDSGNSWQSLEISNLQWSCVTFGEHKFIACSIDGDNQIAVLDNSLKKPSWQYVEAPLKNTWKSISYGSRVFICVSHEGNTISSFDGFRWIKVPSPYGIWNDILRTPYFFIVFSIGKDSEELNAMRSSNGGLLGISFASLNEIIANEKSDKAISISGLNGFLDYIENEKGLKAQDIRVSLIDNNIEHITSFNNILSAGDYLVKKKLGDAPELSDFNQSFLIVHEVESYNKPSDKNSYETYQTVYKVKDNMVLDVTGYTRRYNKDNDTFSMWEKQNIYQDEIEHIDLSKNNISVSKKGTLSSCTTFLMTGHDNLITSVENINLSNNKFSVEDNILNSASSTFLVTDEKGSIYKLQKLDIKLDINQIENLGKLAELNSVNLEREEVQGFLPQNKLIKNQLNDIDSVESIISLDHNNEISEISKDKLLNNVGQIKFVELSSKDNITDCNQLLDSGIYYLDKSLKNTPPNSMYIKVVNSYSASLGKITYQFAYKDIYKPIAYYSRQTNDALGYGTFIPADWGNLNKIDINNLEFNGVWNINQGGTGSRDGFNYSNTFNIGGFFNKIGFVKGSTQDLVNKIKSAADMLPRFYVIPNSYITKDILVDIPSSLSSVSSLSIHHIDGNTLILRLQTPYWYEEYKGVCNNYIFRGWKKIISQYGELNALSIPSRVYRYRPEEPNSHSYKVGDIVLRYSVKGQNSRIQKVPDGGTWLVETMVQNAVTFNYDFINSGSSITAGGQILNRDNNNSFWHKMTKLS